MEYATLRGNVGTFQRGFSKAWDRSVLLLCIKSFEKVSLIRAMTDFIKSQNSQGESDFLLHLRRPKA